MVVPPGRSANLRPGEGAQCDLAYVPHRRGSRRTGDDGVERLGEATKRGIASDIDRWLANEPEPEAVLGS